MQELAVAGAVDGMLDDLQGWKKGSRSVVSQRSRSSAWLLKYRRLFVQRTT